MFGPLIEMRKWDQVYALPTEKREKVVKAFLMLRRWGEYVILIVVVIALSAASIAGLSAWLLGVHENTVVGCIASTFLLSLVLSLWFLWKPMMWRASRRVDDLIGHDPVLIKEIQRIEDDAGQLL